MTNHRQVQPYDGNTTAGACIRKEEDSPSIASPKPVLPKKQNPRPLRWIKAKANSIKQRLQRKGPIVPPEPPIEETIEEPPEDQFVPPELPIDETIQEVDGVGVGKYKFGNKIGEGAFGAVYLATEEGSEKQVAIKVISRATTETDAKARRQLELECHLLQAHGGEHPNIIGCYEVISAPKNVYIVMEQATTDLLKVVWKKDANKKQPDFCRKVMRGILEAVQYLHERGIAHCDIKLENVLLVTDALDENHCLKPGRRIESSDIRLADFGLAHVSHSYSHPSSAVFESSDGWDKEYNVVVDTPTGTFGYEAPEVYEKGYEGRQSDMWSIGVLFLKIVLFKGELYAIYWKRASHWMREGDEDYLDYAKDLGGFGRQEAWLVHNLAYSRLAVLNPQRRISASKALRHSWF